MKPPTFFASPAAFRSWLEKSHDHTPELWLGFYKRQSRKRGITYPEALDEALCFGWIDGVRKSVDESSYTIRFTPRRPKSKWSAVNVQRVAELTKLRRMRPAGLKAFQARERQKAGYSYEDRPRNLTPAYAKQLRANQRAWDFFRAQTPSYQRTASWWVISAKKEETRQKRLAELIAASEKGEKPGVFILKKSEKGSGV